MTAATTACAPLPAVAGQQRLTTAVRFGIGRPPGRQDPADYVLRDFTAAERKELAYLVDRAADAVEALLADGLDAAQNAFNS